MKVLELKVDDSILDSIKGFLDLLPKSKVKVREIDMKTYSQIPYVMEREQRDIEKILKNRNCHIVTRSKLVKI